jgi:hypothetical protein
MHTFHHNFDKCEKLGQVPSDLIESSNHQALKVLKHVTLQSIQKLYVVVGKLKRRFFKIDTTWGAL